MESSSNAKSPSENQKIRVRKTRINDLENIKQIEDIIFPDPFSFGIFKKYHQASLKEQVFFLVAFTENNTIVGYIIGDFFRSGEENKHVVGHISSIAVIKENRKQGVGSMLLNRVISYFTGIGCNIVGLEVRKSNFIAQTFYKKRGFEIVGTLEHYYEDDEDGLAMSLWLP